MATLPYVAKNPHDNVGNHYQPFKQMNYGKAILQDSVQAYSQGD